MTPVVGPSRLCMDNLGRLPFPEAAKRRGRSRRAGGADTTGNHLISARRIVAHFDLLSLLLNWISMSPSLCRCCNFCLRSAGLRDCIAEMTVRQHHQGVGSLASVRTTVFTLPRKNLRRALRASSSRELCSVATRCSRPVPQGVQCDRELGLHSLDFVHDLNWQNTRMIHVPSLSESSASLRIRWVWVAAVNARSHETNLCKFCKLEIVQMANKGFTKQTTHRELLLQLRVPDELRDAHAGALARRMIGRNHRVRLPGEHTAIGSGEGRRCISIPSALSQRRELRGVLYANTAGMSRCKLRSRIARIARRALVHVARTGWHVVGSLSPDNPPEAHAIVLVVRAVLRGLGSRWPHDWCQARWLPASRHSEMRST